MLPAATSSLRGTKRMRFLFALLLFAAATGGASAQSRQSQPCIWSGSYAKCLPQFGLLLDNARRLQLGPDTDDTHYVELGSANSMASSYSLLFPSTGGSLGQSLRLAGSTSQFEWFTPVTPSSIT